MKKHAIIGLLLLFITVQTQAQSTSGASKTVECSSKTYFSENQCDVCYDGGEVTPESDGVKLNEINLPWENTLAGINQNFYETSQNMAEIKTNIGTAPNPWDETGLEWTTDVVWKDLDGLNMYSLDAGKTINIKTIKTNTKIPLTSQKQPTTPYLVAKIPISYYELKMGTFKESEKKTTNYCVSYTPKKTSDTTASSSGSNTPPATSDTTNTASSNNSGTTTGTSSNSQTISNTTTNSSATSSNGTQTNPSTTSTTNGTQSDTKNTDTDSSTTNEVAASDVNNTSNTNADSIESDIPFYNAKVGLNSAGADPTISAATRVETGPATNIFIILAALFLSILVYPKINKAFH